MTNQSSIEQFKLESQNTLVDSRSIQEVLKNKVTKEDDPESNSKK